MKTINDIGTIAAPPEVQLAILQAINFEHRTRTNLMSSNLHSTENILWWAVKTYQGPFFQNHDVPYVLECHQQPIGGCSVIGDGCLEAQGHEDSVLALLGLIDD